MRKSLFIEFKFGKIDLALLKTVGFSHLILSFSPDAVTSRGRSQYPEFKRLGCGLGISLVAFDYGGCPALPSAKTKLFHRLKEALSFNPDEIWLDHFRFDGHWEEIEEKKIPDLHQPCQHCHNVNRQQFLYSTAKEVTEIIGGRTKVGYFAVPFKEEEVPDFISGLGQDHSTLSGIFDLVSPMLYQRMIKKTTGYISDYVRYLSSKTLKPILPIIQVKDMPDRVGDKLTEGEIREEFFEAVKPPSAGVCFFSFDHAVEKGKTEIIKDLFSIRSA